MRVTEEANCVYSVDLFGRGECLDALARLREAAGWAEAQVVTAGEGGEAVVVDRPEVRTARVLYETPELDLFKDFGDRVDGVIIPLIKSLWRVEFDRRSESQVVRYGPGGHYKPHADGGYFMKGRYFTVLCYLNEDFEGGGTSFPSLGYTATPCSGKAVLFPARFVHCAEPVLAGEKFVAVSWVLGPVPVEWI